MYKGVPHRETLSYADEQDVDAIVMGTHGQTDADRVRLGSTPERVIGLATAPVLSVRSTTDGTRGRTVELDPLLGNTTARIVRRLPILVLTVTYSSR